MSKNHDLVIIITKTNKKIKNYVKKGIKMSNFVSSLRKKIKAAEENNAKEAQWSWERPKTLQITEYDTIESLLHVLGLNFQWWRTRWPQLDENHQSVVINLFGDHPQMLQHIWSVLDKNFDEKDNYRHGHWLVDEMEYVLFEKLGLFSEDVEIEVYRKIPVEEIKVENV